MGEFTFKVICCGDNGVGKTSIIKKAVYDEFSSVYKATLGVDFALKVLELPQREARVNMQIWDIGGQDRQKHMHRVFFRNAVAAILVYDCTREDSFQSVKHWKEEIDKYVFLDEETERPVPTILLANKADVPHQEFLKKDEIDTYCKENGFTNHFYVSALTGRNIEMALKDISEIVLDQCNEYVEENETVPAVNDAFVLGPGAEDKESKSESKRCCT